MAPHLACLPGPSTGLYGSDWFLFLKGEGAGVEGHRQASTDVCALDRPTEISPTHLISVDEESSVQPLAGTPKLTSSRDKVSHPDPVIVQ